MIKIKATYETDEEIERLIGYLKPVIKSCKKQESTGKRRRRAYIEVDTNKIKI